MHVLIRSTNEQDHTGFEVDGGRETQIDTWRGDLASFERKIRSMYRNGHKLTIKHAQVKPEARDYLVEGEGTQSGKHTWFGHTVRAATEAEARAAATSDMLQMQFSGIRIKSISPEG